MGIEHDAANYWTKKGNKGNGIHSRSQDPFARMHTLKYYTLWYTDVGRGQLHTDI